MAKTIEEKAIELMNTLPVDEPKGLVYEAYKKGASDQRKIDIEKACEWLSTLPEQLDVYEDSHYVIDRDTLIEQFKQTMEE